jgi:hypothetical protein
VNCFSPALGGVKSTSFFLYSNKKNLLKILRRAFGAHSIFPQLRDKESVATRKINPARRVKLENNHVTCIELIMTKPKVSGGRITFVTGYHTSEGFSYHPQRLFFTPQKSNSTSNFIPQKFGSHLPNFF